MKELTTGLFEELSQMIEQSRSKVAQQVNAELTWLYWQVGNRLFKGVLQEQRAEYGKQILQTLSAKLVAKYGRGWDARNLAHMIKFAEVFSKPEILYTVCTKLSWSHFRKIIYIEDSLRRDFYVEMCCLERWSVRTLLKQLDSSLFERTVLSRKPEGTIRLELDNLKNSGELSPNFVLKDPYVLDFLELNDRYLEKDLEDAILREMEQFLLEMGAGFTFVARQKRIQIDHEDFYIDLLFYNRKLKRLIVIDLKLGNFKADYKGQMELYLRWLAKYETEAGEESPLGVILCTNKKSE